MNKKSTIKLIKFKELKIAKIQNIGAIVVDQLKLNLFKKFLIDLEPDNGLLQNFRVVTLTI